MTKYTNCGNCRGTGKVTTVVQQPIYAGGGCSPAAKVARASAVPCSCCHGKGRFIETPPGGGGIGTRSLTAELARRLI